MTCALCGRNATQAGEAGGVPDKECGQMVPAAVRLRIGVQIECPAWVHTLCFEKAAAAYIDQAIEGYIRSHLA